MRGTDREQEQGAYLERLRKTLVGIAIERRLRVRCRPVTVVAAAAAPPSSGYSLKRPFPAVLLPPHPGRPAMAARGAVRTSMGSTRLQQAVGEAISRTAASEQNKL